MVAFQVSFFATELLELSLSVHAPTSDELQLTAVVTRRKAGPWRGKSSRSVGNTPSGRALAVGGALMLTVILAML